MKEINALIMEYKLAEKQAAKLYEEVVGLMEENKPESIYDKLRNADKHMSRTFAPLLAKAGSLRNLTTLMGEYDRALANGGTL